MKVMHTKLLSIKLTLIGLLILSNLFSQKIDLSAYQLKYPSDKMIGLKAETHLKIDLVKGKPVIVSTEIEENLILDQSLVNFLAEEEISIHEYETLHDVKAYSINQSGKKSPATHFKTQDAEKSGGIFHDGGKTMSFLYPSLEVGSVRFLSYNKKMTEYKFPKAHFFVNGYSLEKSLFKIDVDTAIQLLIFKRNFENVNIQFEEKVEKGRRVLTWTLLELPALKYEQNRGPIEEFCPVIFAQVASYHYKGVAYRGVSNTKDLFEWYYENVRAVLDEVPSDELKSKAVELTKDLPNELDKVKAIYYWVQEEIKYIAFEAGTEGVIPRFSSKVFEKRFGDCKDMSVLIQKMLSAVGITSYVTWIGTTDIPYNYTDFPSKGSDNHMITVYELDGKTYFLDATSEFQSIDYPTEFIQGKQGLVCISADEFKLVDVPVMACEQTIMHDTTRFEINHRKIIGTTQAALTGYNKISIVDYLQKVEENKTKKLIEGIFPRGNNSFKVLSYKVENDKNREGALNLTFDFAVENYITHYQDEIFVNLLLTKEYAVETDLKLDRQSPFEIGFKSNDLYVSELAIPDGYSIKSIPEDVIFDSDVISFSIRYLPFEKTVVSTVEFYFKKTMVHPSDFPKWIEFNSLLNKNLNKSLVLVKKAS